MHKTYLAEMDFAKNKSKLTDIIDMLMSTIREDNVDLYEHIECELYEAVYGKQLTMDKAKKWVMSMKPSAKWTKEQTDSVLANKGVDLLDGYVVMNMLYSDMHNVLGEGDTPESLNHYIEATKDWLNDEDANNGKEKLFNYWKYIVR